MLDLPFGLLNPRHKRPGVLNPPRGAAPAPDPVVTVPTPGGNKLGTTATITSSGEITITNVNSALSGDLGVVHYMVKAQNMRGKTLVAKRSASDPNADTGGDLLQWQMAYAYDPDGEWFSFENYATAGGVLTASNLTPLTEDTVYVARRPVFTGARWDAAIERWRANPLTVPTISADAQFVVGTLPAVPPHAPAMPLHGFKLGAGPAAVVLTGVIHVDEHIASYAMEALIDWLLSTDPDAAYLRSKCTYYVYPNMNPQALYAGASRNELTTGDNANRIFAATGFDNVPLSKIWRDVWAADLPNPVSGNIDFHDTARGQGGGATFDHVATSGPIVGNLMAEYYSRTGAKVERNPGGTTTGVAGGVARYIRETFGGGWMITAEHYISKVYGVPEWQAWGRDYGRAMRDFYDTDGTAKWRIPDWVTTSSGATTITKVNGVVTGTTPATANPLLAFKMPAGRSIEIVYDAVLTNAGVYYVRQATDETLGLSTSTELVRVSTKPVTDVRKLTVPYDPTRSWLGSIFSRNSPTIGGTLEFHPMTRYRVLP